MSLAAFPTFGLAALAASAGFAFGLAYFTALRRNVTLFLRGGGLPASLAWALARLGAAVALFWFAARLGALPLLMALLGFLAARFMALGVGRSAP